MKEIGFDRTLVHHGKTADCSKHLCRKYIILYVQLQDKISLISSVIC